VRSYEEHQRERNEYLDTFITAFGLTLDGDGDWTNGEFIDRRNVLIEEHSAGSVSGRWRERGAPKLPPTYSRGGSKDRRTRPPGEGASGARCSDHPDAPTIDHPATSLGPARARRARSNAIFSQQKNSMRRLRPPDHRRRAHRSGGQILISFIGEVPTTMMASVPRCQRLRDPLAPPPVVPPFALADARASAAVPHDAPLGRSVLEKA
jgi:hypothetical protein